jgi:hypothetical protein
MCGATSDVRYGPKADITSFDHFVSAGDQRGRNSEAERLCGSEIDGQLVFCRGLYRQVSRLLAFEDTVDI